ncbi:MAG TPA: hypothetical protein VLK65_24615 [Vicinamibacteria bacterium]|nr:hypothetical protein [Vicinamibacteria bacterium]
MKPAPMGGGLATAIRRPSLRGDFSWLRETQLRVALAFYELYPEEIDVRLERERSWTPERLRKELPFTTSLKG